MKKRITAFLLLLVMLSLLSVSAFAATDEDPAVAGAYNLQGNGITMRSENGTAVSASSAYNKYAGFYGEAVKFDVSVSGLTAGKQYLLLVLSDDQVPGADNIVYINQMAANANGAVNFSGANVAYPSSLLNKTTYYVYIVGEGKTFSAGVSQVASFEYYQPYKLGDITDDKVIDTMDAAAAINHYLEKSVLTGNSFLAGDVTKDGVVDTMDAAAMINHYLEKSLIIG